MNKVNLILKAVIFGTAKMFLETALVWWITPHVLPYEPTFWQTMGIIFLLRVAAGSVIVMPRERNAKKDVSNKG